MTMFTITVNRTFSVNMGVFWIYCVYLLCLCILGSGSSDLSCKNLKTLMDNKKLHSSLQLKESTSALRRPCGKEGRTCCSAQVEDVLTVNRRKEFVSAAKAEMNQLYSLLNHRARRFNDCFTTLLLGSKKDFDEMFKATYGIIYEENAYLFTDLFEELERYYSKGQVNLEDAMEHFFNTLYQKMFTVLNAQYKFDEKYLGCVSEHMKDLKPFGDVPHKLSVQVKRSFVATRTLAQSLNVARDVVLNMQNLGLAGDCSQALMRMSHCQYCKDASEAKLCNGLCLNVMRGCLAYHSQLDTEWNHFLDALDKVLVRLLGPFNIENVVEPIDIKISEAIMNFQENAPDVSEKVFQGCGRPNLNRRGRNAGEIELRPYQFVREEQKTTPNMEKLMREIRIKLKESRGFWGNLPNQMCLLEITVDDTKDDKIQCWNGTDVGRYSHQIVSTGLHSQASNPEVHVDTTRPKILLNEQIFVLKMLTSKLKNAYNGYDVDWVDLEEIGASAGNGSGDGSGDDELPTEGSGREDYDDNERDDSDDPVDGSVPGSPPLPNNESIPPPTNKPTLAAPAPQPIPPGSRPTSRGSSTHRPDLFRVVTAYIFPIYVIWLGGLFSDWL